MSPSRSQPPSVDDTPQPGERAAGVTVKPAQLRDLLPLAALQKRAFPPRLAYTISTLALLWVLPWVRLLVAWRQGEIAGCIIGDRTLDGGRVINLAVDPVAQRQGVGTALLHAIEQSLPGGDMTLMVQVENDGARSLYRRVGYADETVMANYYGSGRAGVRMRKPRVTDRW